MAACLRTGIAAPDRSPPGNLLVTDPNTLLDQGDLDVMADVRRGEAGRLHVETRGEAALPFGPHGLQKLAAVDVRAGGRSVRPLAIVKDDLVQGDADRQR